MRFGLRADGCHRAATLPAAFTHTLPRQTLYPVVTTIGCARFRRLSFGARRPIPIERVQYLRCGLLEKHFPAAAETIDWHHPPQWSDKELSQILGQVGQRNRTVDLLVQVRLRSGEPQWILLHLEVQTSNEADFAERLASFGVRRLVAAFLFCGLATFQALPPGLKAAPPQTKAVTSHSSPKTNNLGYNAEDVRELFRIIDWMMHLREDLTERFKQELNQLEESLQMPHVTSVERLAKAEGIAEGGAMVLLNQLAKLCGPLSEEVQQRIHRLPFEQLSALGEALLDFRSLADLQAWLDANECADD